MDLNAIFFYLLFKNPIEALEHYNKVKMCHLNERYLDLYSIVNSYYDKHFMLPSFDALELLLRNEKIHSKILSVKKLKIDDSEIDIEIVVDALVNEHIQNEALTKIESLVKNITLLDAEEIKIEFNNISMDLEDQSSNVGSVNSMADLFIANETEVCLDQTPTGVSEYIDNEVKIMTTELIMLGGMRGSGKSIVVNNIAVNQYKQGDVGLLFSIEMRKQEIYNRSMAMLSGVDFTKIRNGNLNDEDYLRLAKVEKDMFDDSDSIYERFLETKDFRKFEIELAKNKKLKADNQLIIVDNQKLTLADIDSVLTKQKSIFGSKLRTCQIDYVNQIHLESDQYDWKAQITLSKRLKDLARKHEISIISPYQIDKEGEARFAKGLLDAADIAMILEVNENTIKFKSTKIRSGSHFETAVNIGWESLTIDPRRVSSTSKNEKDPIARAKGVNDV